METPEGDEAPSPAAQLRADVQRRLKALRHHMDAQLLELEAIEQAVQDDLALLASERQELARERDSLRETVAAAHASEKAELESQRDALEAERAQLEEERGRVRAVGECQRDTVLLDVGGVNYRTCRSTLLTVPGSLLCAMFSGAHDALLLADADGRAFLDRDGALFAHVLNFLRDRSTLEVLATLSERERLALRLEARYFGLEEEMFPSARRVLLCGGHDGAEALRSTELLKASAGLPPEVVPGPELQSRRNGCAAAPLAPGRLLVLGGFDGTTRLESTEILDLDTASSSAGPSMCRPRSVCAAALLDEGRLLVLGGHDGEDVLDSTELLNLASMLFSPGPRMASRRRVCASCLLDDRRLIVVGGHDGTARLGSTELLDLKSMVFEPGPEMGTPRSGCCAVLLDRDRLLVLGGHDGERVLESTELLALGTMAFEPGPPMAKARLACAAALLDERRLVVAGGVDDEGTTEILDLQTMAFSPGPPLASRRWGAFASPC